jgi:hypothetical protein
LTRKELSDYYQGIKEKIKLYLDGLTDEMLSLKPDRCRYTRLALVLGQFRHLYCHTGIINCSTIYQTGKWPRVVGMDADFSKEYDLFE